MIQALADQVEIDSLEMLDHKQNWLAAAQGRLNQGVAAIQSGANGLATAAGLQTAPATTQPATGEETAGIVSRSPRTINNSYPPPPAVAAKSDAPWVALICIALLIATALGLAWMLGPAQNGNDHHDDNGPRSARRGDTSNSMVRSTF